MQTEKKVGGAPFGVFWLNKHIAGQLGKPTVGGLSSPVFFLAPSWEKKSRV